MAVQTTYPTAMPVAFAGLLADSGFTDKRSFSQGEASAEVPFGVAVAQGNTATKAVLPAGGAAVILGVVLHSHDYAPTLQLGTTGIKPKNMMSVLNRGRVWVQVEDAVAVGGRCFVRHTASGGNTQLGKFRSNADTATAIEWKGARYLTAASGGGLAMVEVDANVFRATNA